MNPVKTNLVVHVRTTLKVVFTITDLQGVAYDLTNHTIAASAEGSTTNIPGGSLDLQPVIDTPATAGIASFVLTPAQTTLLTKVDDPGKPVPKWDILLTDTAAGETIKLTEGDFDIKDTITP